jgi:hypothetical protein
MNLTDFTPPYFIAGYKHHPEQETVYWLCNHPESIDLIFSKNKNTAFTFDHEQLAVTAIEEILIAENHPWYTPVVIPFEQENPSMTLDNTSMNLKQAEAKINDFLQLFNERSNSGLELYLTLNKKENSIRGYGSNRKIGDAVSNFVALLAIKGMKAHCLNSRTFEVKIDS